MKTATAALAASALGVRSAFAAKDIPIATQMWVVKEEARQDLGRVLAALAEMGFQGVEFADEYFGHTPQAIRKMLDDNGLRVAGNHINLEHMMGDRFDATVAMHETLGATNLIVRSLKKEQYNTLNAVLEFAMNLNQINERLEKHGMRTGFHNHSEIFNRYNGEMAWNILADNTRPDVILQLDTGNAMHSKNAGVDIAQLVRRNAGRTITTHIKPYHPTKNNAYIGDDQMDWKTIINLMDTVGGTEWYIIEYEVPGIPPLEALRDNLARFKQIRATV